MFYFFDPSPFPAPYVYSYYRMLLRVLMEQMRRNPSGNRLFLLERCVYVENTCSVVAHLNLVWNILAAVGTMLSPIAVTNIRFRKDQYRSFAP
jgi:hypothetical protein